MNNFIGLLFFLTIIVYRLDGQISIIPLYSYQRGAFCNYEKPFATSPTFKKNSPIGDATFGVFLKILPVTPKINLYTGVYHGSLDWGYRLFNSRTGAEIKHGMGAFIFKFPVFINFFDSKTGRNRIKNAPHKKRNVFFRTYFGGSFDYVPFNEEYFNMGADFNIGVGGSAPIAYDEYIHLITTKGTSIISGCSFYIFNNTNQKESFALSVFYWQGLVNLLGIDVWYTIDSSSYYTKLFSRGTSVDLVLSYNIPVNYKGKKLFRKKTEKKT